MFSVPFLVLVQLECVSGPGQCPRTGNMYTRAVFDAIISNWTESLAESTIFPPSLSDLSPIGRMRQPDLSVRLEIAALQHPPSYNSHKTDPSLGANCWRDEILGNLNLKSLWLKPQTGWLWTSDVVYLCCGMECGFYFDPGSPLYKHYLTTLAVCVYSVWLIIALCNFCPVDCDIDNINDDLPDLLLTNLTTSTILYCKKNTCVPCIRVQLTASLEGKIWLLK